MALQAVYYDGPLQPHEARHQQKVRKLEQILQEDPVDVDALRLQAISDGGLVNSQVRRRAWPILLNVNIDNIPPRLGLNAMEQHSDCEQVIADVRRSDNRFPRGMNKNRILSLQDQAIEVIMRVLVGHPELKYYQGFHDICLTLLLAAEDEDVVFAVAESLAENHFKSLMEPQLISLEKEFEFVSLLISKVNPKLLQYLEEMVCQHIGKPFALTTSVLPITKKWFWMDASKPSHNPHMPARGDMIDYYCIPWLVTWFSSCLKHMDCIFRIFDQFIACNPMMPLYVTAAIVLHKEREIFETEQEMGDLFAVLTNLPQPLFTQGLFNSAGILYLKYPPDRLADQTVQLFERYLAVQNATEDSNQENETVSQTGTSDTTSFGQQDAQLEVLPLSRVSLGLEFMEVTFSMAGGY